MFEILRRSLRTVQQCLFGPNAAPSCLVATPAGFGGEGLTLDRQEDAEDVVMQALACERAVVVDVRSSLETISAYPTITKLRGDR